jgi:hypothetical protein
MIIAFLFVLYNIQETNKPSLVRDFVNILPVIKCEPPRKPSSIVNAHGNIYSDSPDLSEKACVASCRASIHSVDECFYEEKEKKQWKPPNCCYMH